MSEILRKSNEGNDGLKEKIKNPAKVAAVAAPAVENATKGTALDQANGSGGFGGSQKDGTNA